MRYILILFLFLGLACKSDKPRDLILGEEELIDLIIDLQIAKAAVYKYPMEQRDSINDVYYEQIFTIHQITRYELEHDIAKLEKNPLYYKTIMDKVSAELKFLSKSKDSEIEDDYE